MDKKRLAHRWSFALRIVAALVIVCSMPNPSFAGFNWYVWGANYTGPVGRVLEWRDYSGYIYGTYSGATVNYSTDPYRLMDPVINNYPYPGNPGITYPVYIRHEHFYTPSPDPLVTSHSGQTSSTFLSGQSSFFGWNTSNLSP